VLVVPLPRVLGSPLCPAQALLLLFKMVRCLSNILIWVKGENSAPHYNNL
jgi:hypothetical protein